jgi:methyl-accepting chemotaxis protein
MKLGLKIGLGFAALLAIAATLGILAIVNMKNVQTKSISLQSEYVPEVAIANRLERSSFRAMYAMRGYGFTEEKAFLDDARSHLQSLHERLAEAKTLADKSPSLKALRPAAEKVEGAVKAYEKLVEETVSVNAQMNNERQELDAAAAQYMTNCNTFLAGQTENLQNEIRRMADPSALAERLEKITLVNDIIDVGNMTRIAAWRSQAQREPKIIQDASGNFSTMEEKFSALRKITRMEEDLKRIDQTEESAKQYQAAMNQFLTLWLRNEELSKERAEVGGTVTDEARNVAIAGMDGTMSIAEETVRSLATASTVMIVGLILAVIFGVASPSLSPGRLPGRS